LLVSNRAQALELRRIIQADEVNSLVVETPPARPMLPLPKRSKYLFAVVAQQIVLAGDEEVLPFAVILGRS
jgi:hypothetical protein